MRLLIALLATFAPHALAADPQPLSGTWHLAGRTLVDPPPDEPVTHLYLELDGAAAKALYDALDAPALEDECLGDGSMSKARDGTWCVHFADGGGFECTLGIDLGTQRVDARTPC